MGGDLAFQLVNPLLTTCANMKNRRERKNLREAQESSRACANTQRTLKSLRLATEVLRREGLVKQTFGATELSCESLEARWKEWTSKMLLTKSGKKKLRLSAAFKGTKTLFDEPCFVCDGKK